MIPKKLPIVQYYYRVLPVLVLPISVWILLYLFTASVFPSLHATAQ